MTASFFLPLHCGQFSAARHVLAALLVGCAATAAQAKPPAEFSCQYSKNRQISFSTPTAQDRLVVSIGAGPCRSAKLSITVTSVEGKVLYSYASEFMSHMVLESNDPDLVTEARQFVDDTVAHALVKKSERPVLKPRPVAQDGEPIFRVSSEVYKRLMSSGQPMLYHSTYYEGGQYVVFDPQIGKARVVADVGV